MLTSLISMGPTVPQRPADRRLTLPQPVPDITAGILDAMPSAVLLCDERSRIRLANAAADQMLARHDSGVHACAAAFPGGGFLLTARHRSDASLLRQAVEQAARGSRGRSLRIRRQDTEDAPMQVVLISRASGGLALVVIEDLVRRNAPPAAILCTLFGLSAAEAEVAIGLVGGASAEEVAARRNVSLETVRKQIRSILVKSETVNLRDFERLMARLAALATGAEDREALRDKAADHPATRGRYSSGPSKQFAAASLRGQSCRRGNAA